MNIPTRWVSIDPGDRFVGFALWNGTEVVQAEEITPEECIHRLECLTGMPNVDSPLVVCSISLVVYEKFTLYAWNEKSMAGNEFKTCQLIGTIKYMCSRAEVECVGQFASEGKSTYRRQPFKQWGTKQWKQAIKGPIGRGHTRDAVAHGYELLRRRGFVPSA